MQTSLLTLDGLRHLVLPALNLAIPNLALIIRLVAAGTTETMTQDYVKYARARACAAAASSAGTCCATS